jgi:hypothetical protein
MDNLPMLLSGSVAGYVLGRYLNTDNNSLKQLATNTASKAIDTFVELKWAWRDLWGTPVYNDEKLKLNLHFKLTWIQVTEDYKIYQLNDKVYITFNMSHEPTPHYEDGTIESITVISKDGGRGSPSPALQEVLVQCAGHGCTYNSGVPTLGQLKTLPQPKLKEELEKIKKIIINTSSFEEHIVKD